MASIMSNSETLAMEEPPTTDELLEALISQAEDITLKGFNLMEEHAARGYQKAEDLACLQQCVDKIFQKVQENVVDNLTRWADYCDTLSSVAQADAKTVPVSRSTGANGTAPCADNFNDLRQELSSWSGALVAQEQKAAELSEEMKLLETELLAAKQLAELDTASNSPPLWRAAELSKVMERLGDVIRDESEGTKTPRHFGPSRLSS